MPPEKEKPVSGTVEIHPYVQGRLRSLPRLNDTAGILLGTSENGVTHVTGFKRVPPNALRQAADAAGPELAGFYRLQTAGVPALMPEERELWQESQGHSLFMLIRAADGHTPAEATVWTRGKNGEPAVETVPLDVERVPAPAQGSAPSLRREDDRRAIRVPWRAIAAASAALAVVLAALQFWPVKPPPAVSLDLQARQGELTALWDQKGGPAGPPKSATLRIRDGAIEQTIDLTRNFTPQGRIVLRPLSRDIVITINVQYAGIAPISGSATYIGFFSAAGQADSATNETKGAKKTGPRRRARFR
jgi:hypothetical protein